MYGVCYGHLRLKRNKPYPHPDTCPVNPKSRDKISMKYYEMSKKENESHD